MVTGIPDLTRFKQWLGPATVAAVDVDLQMILDGAVDGCRARCPGPFEDPEDDTTPEPELPAPLVEAILRRGGKAVASKGIPLGIMIADLDYQGPITVRRWDAEIEDREGPYRRPVVA